MCPSMRAAALTAQVCTLAAMIAGCSLGLHCLLHRPISLTTACEARLQILLQSCIFKALHEVLGIQKEESFAPLSECELVAAIFCAGEWLELLQSLLLLLEVPNNIVTGEQSSN
jgi:hypothetical protein